MPDKNKSSSKHDKIEPGNDPASMDFQSLDELKHYYDQKHSTLTVELEMVLFKNRQDNIQITNYIKT